MEKEKYHSAGVKSITSTSTNSEERTWTCTFAGEPIFTLGYSSCKTNNGRYSLGVSSESYTKVITSGYATIGAITGVRSLCKVKGDRSIAATTGLECWSKNNGYLTISCATADYSEAYNEGIWTVSAVTGYGSTALNSGDCSISLASTYNSKAIVKGKESIAITTGVNCAAKGHIGCWLVLTEREKRRKENSPIKNIKVVKVDGKIIKANTFYTLKDNKVVEFKE